MEHLLQTLPLCVALTASKAEGLAAYCQPQTVVAGWSPVQLLQRNVPEHHRSAWLRACPNPAERA